MFAPGLSLAVLSFALGVHGQNKWEFYVNRGLEGMLSFGRLDPILFPGQVSAHTHMFQGANALSATYDYDTIRSESTCSTVLVQDDLSNYWAPAMYHYDGAGKFSLMMRTKFNIYYHSITKSWDANNPSGSTQRYPFPEGLTMIAGNMTQRVINETDPRSTASNFQCLRADKNNSPYDHDIRHFQQSGLNCDQSLRATTEFPSCWDGVADNSDLNHVVYPDWRGVCPESHPRAFMRLTYEWYFPVQDFPFDPKRVDNWIFSYGDNSGFGMHGDFTNGWNITLLEEAIHQCDTDESGIEKCPPLARWNYTLTPPCMPSGLYPNEPVGLDGQSLAELPGCNPLWKGNVSKPTCDNPPSTPKLNLQLGPDLSKWNYLSCPFSYNSQHQMMFSAHSRSGWENMTVDSCLTECSGYKYAMMMGGTNCYCDNEVRNGGSLVSDPDYPCQVHCTDKYLEYCGGLGSGQVYEACEGNACHANSAFPPMTTAPPTWDTTAATASVGAGSGSINAGGKSTSSSAASASTSLSSSPPTSASSSGLDGTGMTSDTDDVSISSTSTSGSTISASASASAIKNAGKQYQNNHDHSHRHQHTHPQLHRHSPSGN